MKLRPEYQEPAHEASIKHCKLSADPAIHDQSVGAGKTVQIAFMSKHVSDKGGYVLNISRQGELCEQNSSDCWSIGCRCSIFSGSLNMKSTSFPVIYGTEKTVFNYLKTTFKDKKIDLLQIDECHEVDWKDAQQAIKKMKKGEDFYSEDHSQYAVIIAHFMKINPSIRILGYSGSAFRGSESILNPNGFWKKRLSHVTTYFLVGIGFLVPPVFGFGDDKHKYIISDSLSVSENENDSDFSPEQLKKMQKEILAEEGITKIIMEEVVQRAKDRNGVLITCAGKKHCEQVAKYLPEGSYGIVTDETSFKKRSEILKKADKMEIKYVLQINCLGQGVNIPSWDTCVILRRIGSKRYLIQLLGRVFRTLKDYHIDLGLVKDDALILDYTDTIECMGEIFNDDPMLAKAVIESKKMKHETQECPLCSTENSVYAVRCIGEDKTSKDKRCEHFFQFSVCQACQTQNAPTAQSCRNCDAVMIDPARALKGKAYTDADYKPVLSMDFEKNKSGGLSVVFTLDSTIKKDGLEHQEIATEYYDPASKDRARSGRWWAFVRAHINNPQWQRSAMAMKKVDQIIKSKAIFDVPTHITHRVNDKGFSIVNRRKFLSGREAK